MNWQDGWYGPQWRAGSLVLYVEKTRLAIKTVPSLNNFGNRKYGDFPCLNTHLFLNRFKLLIFLVIFMSLYRCNKFITCLWLRLTFPHSSFKKTLVAKQVCNCYYLGRGGRWIIICERVWQSIWIFFSNAINSCYNASTMPGGIPIMGILFYASCRSCTKFGPLGKIL